MFDEEGSCWGHGVTVCGAKISQPVWHNILYVAVHLSLIDLDFNLSHLKAIMKCIEDTCCHHQAWTFTCALYCNVSQSVL